MYIIKEFQRLKTEENNRLKLDWNLERTISKINYQIHTDALLIQLELPQKDRLVQLNKVAISQMKSLVENSMMKKLKY